MDLNFIDVEKCGLYLLACRELFLTRFEQLTVYCLQIESLLLC